MRKFSSGTIQNEVLTIIYEHTYSENNFNRKLQSNKSPFPSILLPTYQYQSMLDQYFEIKFKDNISPYNQRFEQLHEELIDLKVEKKRNKKSSHHNTLRMK